MKMKTIPCRTIRYKEFPELLLVNHLIVGWCILMQHILFAVGEMKVSITCKSFAYLSNTG